MIPNQGGKSKTSKPVAAVVNSIKMPALVTKPGLYDFGLKGNRWMRDIDDGSEYKSHMKSRMTPRAMLNTML